MSNSSEDTSGFEIEELPKYEEYADVIENITNMTVELRRIEARTITIPVADIDSVSQVKRRVRKHCHIADRDEIELREAFASTVLSNDSSLAQLCIADGASLDLCIIDQQGNVLGPNREGKAESIKNISGRKAGSLDVEDDIVDDESPPEYSLLDQFRMRNVELPAVEGNMSLNQKICRIIVTVVVVTINLGLFWFLPLALVIIGGLTLSRCPAQPNLPLWMIVFGGSYLSSKLLDLVGEKIRKNIEKELRMQPEWEVHPRNNAFKKRVLEIYRTKHKCLNQIDHLAQVFLLVWFIIGTGWTFRCECRQDFHNANISGNLIPQGCDQRAFKLTYVIQIICYVSVGI